MTLSEERDDLLHREADLLGRHLVGRAPGQELSERYVAANHALLAAFEADGAPARDRAVLAFARRHPWSLPLLDAAAGLLAPRCLLRRKALLMTAILEATPDFAEELLPRTGSAPGFFLGCAWLGLRAAWKAALGILIWPLAAASSSTPGGGR